MGSLQVGQSSGGDGQPQQQTDAATRERDDTAATSKGEARTAKAEKQMSSGRGQAHDPLLDHLYLNIGPSAAGPARDESVGAFVLSESPATAEDGVDIFEQAYRQEIQRIVGEHQQQQQRNEDGSERKDDSQHGRRREPTLYLTRRVEGSKRLVRDLESMAGRVIGIGGKPTTAESGKAPASKFAMLMDKLGGGKGSDEPTASPKAEDAVS